MEGAAAVMETQTATVGQVIDRETVQQIPLNGRHFLDLTNLTPGTVVPPANGSLTAPSRGLGANSFVTAGNREDTNNFQINGDQPERYDAESDHVSAFYQYDVRVQDHQLHLFG